MNEDDSTCEMNWEQRIAYFNEIRELEYQAHIDKIDAAAEKAAIFKDSDKID